MTGENITRTPDELQYVHDLIVGLLADPTFKKQAGREDLAIMQHFASVLCWALRHDHDTDFADFLKDLKSELAAAGYEIVERCEPTN